MLLFYKDHPNGEERERLGWGKLCRRYEESLNGGHGRVNEERKDVGSIKEVELSVGGTQERWEESWDLGVGDKVNDRH